MAIRNYCRVAPGLALFVYLFFLPPVCLAFAPKSGANIVGKLRRSSLLFAKKKGQGGKGFAKQAPVEQPKNEAVPNSSVVEGGLQSIEAASTTDVQSPPPIEFDPDSTPEERRLKILREQYGMKTAAEQEADIAKRRQQMERAGTLKKRKDKLEKYRQMSDEEFDVFEVIPAPLLRFIDWFLKTGLAVTTTLFVAAGIGITVEAWSKATGSDLPQGWDEFIVRTVEPNFTTGLLVLLGFSISLGVFATAQLGSGSSVYSEDP